MKLLIDADILKYRAAASIEKLNKETGLYDIEPVHHAYYNVNSMVRKMKVKLRCTDAEFFLTPKNNNNFRYKIDPNYKANRKQVRLPIHLQDVHDYIKKRYNANESKGQEADDDITIRHYELNSRLYHKAVINSVICSIDKDFNNVPGYHYNFVKDCFYYVSELEAKKNFYLQILTGDSADNVPRIKKGWRQKKVEELLQNALTEQEMIDIVLLEIKKNVNEWECKTDDYMTKIGQLLHLRTYPNELWRIPR